MVILDKCLHYDMLRNSLDKNMLDYIDNRLIHYMEHITECNGNIEEYFKRHNVNYGIDRNIIMWYEKPRPSKKCTKWLIDTIKYELWLKNKGGNK